MNKIGSTTSSRGRMRGVPQKRWINGIFYFLSFSRKGAGAQTVRLEAGPLPIIGFTLNSFSFA